MITFERGNNKFIYRAAAIIMNEGKVLIHKSERDSFWAMPGGRVEMSEPSNKTIIREMKEELDIEASIIRLLYMAENFFEYEGVRCHELGMYYLLNVDSGRHIFEKEEFTGEDGGTKLIFKWQDTDRLENIELYPTFLRHGLKNPPETVTHIIHRDPNP